MINQDAPMVSFLLFIMNVTRSPLKYFLHKWLFKTLSSKYSPNKIEVLQQNIDITQDEKELLQLILKQSSEVINTEKQVENRTRSILSVVGEGNAMAPLHIGI